MIQGIFLNQELHLLDNMANETKNTTSVTNGTKIEGTDFDTPFKSGSGLTWKEATKTWADTTETWDELETTLSWGNQTKN